MANVIADGCCDDAYIETEIRIPRANLGVSKGDVIRIWTVGNKSGSNFQSLPKTIVMRLAK